MGRRVLSLLIMLGLVVAMLPGQIARANEAFTFPDNSADIRNNDLGHASVDASKPQLEQEGVHVPWDSDNPDFYRLIDYVLWEGDFEQPEVSFTLDVMPGATVIGIGAVSKSTVSCPDGVVVTVVDPDGQVHRAQL